MAFADLIGAVDRVALAVFGESTQVVYTPSADVVVSVVPVEVTGIFDAQYVLAKASAEAGVEVLAPAVFLRLEDLPTDPEDDEPTLTIRGVDYTVRERIPDGMGGIVLGLRTAT